MDTDNDVVLSTDPTFVSLVFGENDSIPDLESADFTCEYDVLLGDSVIVNLDSLPYQTRIDSVNPTFTFTTSNRAFLYFINGDSVAISGKDTIDFSQVKKIRNYAADGVTARNYRIKINVHKVEPELYVWKRFEETLETENVLFQKTILHNDSLYYYFNDGTKAFLSKSKNGNIWTAKIELSNFPTATSLDDIKQFNGKIYITQDGSNIYSSANGSSWEKTTKDIEFKSLLFEFENKLWAVVQSSDSTYHFANSSNGNDWTTLTTKFPDNFPIYGHTSLAFSTRTGKPKVLVVGGYKSDNTYSNTIWSSEDCNYWIDFSSSASARANSLSLLAPGASIIKYDNKLLLFGAEKKGERLTGDHLRLSIDEGYSWQKADELSEIRFGVKSKTPNVSKPGTEKDTIIYTNMPFRTFQSVVVDGSKNIYVIGGKDALGLKKDVWVGKLNRLSFLIQ